MGPTSEELEVIDPLRSCHGYFIRKLGSDPARDGIGVEVAKVRSVVVQEGSLHADHIAKYIPVIFGLEVTGARRELDPVMFAEGVLEVEIVDFVDSEHESVVIEGGVSTQQIGIGDFDERVALSSMFPPFEEFSIEGEHDVFEVAHIREVIEFVEAEFLAGRVLTLVPVVGALELLKEEADHLPVIRGRIRFDHLLHPRILVVDELLG